MEFTNEHIEAIKAAAKPLDYGSITIYFGEVNNYIDIDINRRIRVGKQPGTAIPGLARSTRETRRRKN